MGTVIPVDPVANSITGRYIAAVQKPVVRISQRFTGSHLVTVIDAVGTVKGAAACKLISQEKS